VLVFLEVALQIIDLGRQQGDLHFRGSRVTLLLGKLGDDLGFLFSGKGHCYYSTMRGDWNNGTAAPLCSCRQRDRCRPLSFNRRVAG
jgi:hypothetical protein